MTEIRHDRPILKYLDNLRRENQRAAVLGQTKRLPKSVLGRPTPRRLNQPKDDQIYARHLEKFEFLSDKSKNSIGDLFEGANTLMEARIEYIQSIGSGKRTGKRKSHYDDAYSAMRTACAAYNAQCKTEAKDGKSPAREWFAKLRVVMGSEWIDFEEIDELIKETR